jgi:RimJ/RimL family protein N-acetyltransferase
MKNKLIESANIQDNKIIMTTQILAFEDDNKNKPEGASKGLPSGCNSLKWNTDRILDNQVYKIVNGGEIIGGIILFDLGYGKIEIGRIWIVPEHQNRGIGNAVFKELFLLHKEVIEWYIETPEWAKRNQYLYEKIGFKKIGEVDLIKVCGWREYKYRKKMEQK